VGCLPSHPARVGTFDDQISIGTTAKLSAAVDKWDSIVEYACEKYHNGRCASKLILMVDLIQTYRRVIRASEQGNGVRLSPEECFHMANIDDAIRQAVASAD
jgi:hypothetical protein